jgi:hypothetical protein
VGAVFFGLFLGFAKLLRIAEVTDVMRLVTRRLGSGR